ncbi:MAG: phosphate ABC transporter substrate-binding protein PstS [Candidatus Njordarchaeia archaeon]
MLTNQKRLLGLLIVISILSVAAWYSFSNSSETIQLKGAGSSFIYPLMAVWAKEFQKIHSNVTVNYQSIGSGGGIRAIIDGTVNFAASDAPMNRDEYLNATAKGTIIHLPITVGAAVLAYNLPGLKERLVLSGDIVAKIYLGEIVKWNDPRIQALNPNVSLPDQDIIVVKRSDSSGTTYMFTDYLSHVSKEWRDSIGKTKIFSFPPSMGDRGLSAKGNEGVTGVVYNNPYSIGYIELTYALESDVKYALLKNRAGNIVDANATTISDAAKGVFNTLPSSTDSWENVSIVDVDAPLAWPISSFVYILVYEEQHNADITMVLKQFLSWITSDGQSFSDPLHYAPLPQEIINKNLAAIDKIHLVGGGETVYLGLFKGLFVSFLADTYKECAEKAHGLGQCIPFREYLIF